MKIEWNKVIYADCMNEVNGLPTLPDKSIDLCITDPPYNVNAKPNSQSKGNSPFKDMGYNDIIENYEEWSILWFNEINRISNRIIFTCGQRNLSFWLKYKEPIDIIYHFKPNGAGITSTCWQNLIEPYLLYGNWKKCFTSNVIIEYLRNGFLRRKKDNFIHPHPKERELYFKIIDQINPQSVIDPFLGSGTTAEVCTKLGIPWIGYEIMKEYSVDIDKRLKNCKKEPQQIGLKNYL